MNPNFHSLSACLDLILNQNFLIPFLFSIARVDLNGKKKLLWCLSSMNWHSWVIPEADQNLYSLPTLRTSVQTFQTYLMKRCSSLVFTTLFYHSSTTYFVLLRLSVIFMLAVSTSFCSARSGCYTEWGQMVLWHAKDQSFKAELVTDCKRSFSCEPRVLWERLVLMTYINLCDSFTFELKQLLQN